MGYSSHTPPSIFVGNYIPMMPAIGGIVANASRTAIRSTANNAVGDMFVWPLWTKNAFSVDTWAFWNGTGSAATPSIFRIGVYTATSATNPYPYTRVADVGNISINGTGLLTLAGTVNFSADTLYWIAVKVEQAASTTTGTMATVGRCYPYTPYLSTNTIISSDYFTPPGKTGVATGAFADPCVTGLVSDSTAINDRFPLVFAKVSA